MAQYAGRLVLLNIGDGGTPTEIFSNLCGLTTRSFVINNNVVDVSTPDCTTPSNPVAYAGDYGIQQFSISGEGRYTDKADHTVLANAAVNQSKPNMQIVVPGWGRFEGQALIESYEISGEMQGDASFTAKITLSGAITFTAA